MKSKSFAFAALRVISLWMFTNYVIMNMMSFAVNLYNYYSEPYHEDGLLSSPYFMPLFMLVISSIISWFLWFKADALSNRLITTEVNENNIEAFSSDKIYSAALTILGFYFVFSSIPDLISKLVFAYNYNPVVGYVEKNQNLIAIIKPVITLFIGLFCIMKIENIKQLINKLQNIGKQNAS